MSIEFWEILTVLLASSTKFFPSPFLAVNVYGLAFGQTVLWTSLGGIFGVLFFYGLSGELMDRARRRRLRKLAEGKVKRKRNFRPVTKISVRVKQRFGLIGLAFITPAIISIPFGSILAAKYFRRRGATLPALFLSVLLWSLLLTGIASLFGSPFHH